MRVSPNGSQIRSEILIHIIESLLLNGSEVRNTEERRITDKELHIGTPDDPQLLHATASSIMLRRAVISLYSTRAAVS